MKTSNNYVLPKGDYLLLYNAATDEVPVLRPETAALYKPYTTAGPTTTTTTKTPAEQTLLGGGFLF